MAKESRLTIEDCFKGLSRRVFIEYKRYVKWCFLMILGKVVIYFLATEPFATAPIKDLSKLCIVGLMMIFTEFSVELYNTNKTSKIYWNK